VKTAAAQPTCPNTDGTAKITAQCYCGSAAVVGAADKFCYSTKGTGAVTAAAQPVCPNTDGSAKITAQCYCGNKAVVGAVDKFCNVGQDADGVVSDTLACPDAQADGTTKAAAACSCGKDKVATAQDAFCFTKADKTGAVTAASTIACAGDYTNGKKATATVGCYCGTSAKSTINTAAPTKAPTAAPGSTKAPTAAPGNGTSKTVAAASTDGVNAGLVFTALCLAVTALRQ